jgi:pimeloyl-ACP methyl ester carboxylesterase
MVGLEQLVKKLNPVYDLLGETFDDKVTLLTRNGLHGIAARDVERYIDFFDRTFGIKNVENTLNTYYGFYPNDREERVSKKFSKIPIEDLLDHKADTRQKLLQSIKDYLGKEPPGIKNARPGDLNLTRNSDDWVAKLMAAQDKIGEDGIGNMLICPYNAMGDYLYANLYYPVKHVEENRKIPVVVFLHTYSTATGFRWRIAPFIQSLVREGVAVLAFDQLGFGTRMEEGTQFEQRYPTWTRMGKMISDVKGGIDALESFDWVDNREIYLAGNNMGSQIAGLTAALDARVKGFMAYGGLGSLEHNDHALKELSEEFGLIPSLTAVNSKLPFDWTHILALSAKKKLLIIDPQFDRHNRVDSNDHLVLYADLEKNNSYFKRFEPKDWNRFRADQQIFAAQMLLELIKQP